MSRVLGGSRKKWIAALFVSGWICSLPIAAAEAAVPKMDKALPCFDEGSASDKPETPRMRDKEEFSSGGRLGGGMHSWRQMHEVFRAQPEESRQRLMLLMRENPREFHKEMQTLFIAHQKQKHAEFEAFAALVERCRSCRDDAEKDQQIAELRKIVHAQFLRQLKDHAANLEEMRKKLEALEKQYKFRAEHVDKIVDAGCGHCWSMGHCLRLHPGGGILRRRHHHLHLRHYRHCRKKRAVTVMHRQVGNRATLQNNCPEKITRRNLEKECRIPALFLSAELEKSPNVW